MSTQGPNPLRPYYIPPPPVGLSVDSLPPPSLPSPPATVSSSSGSSFSLLSDLQDYTDYLDAPSPNEVLKSFLTQAAIQYSLNLIAQPFENSKTVLQCRIVPREEGPQEGVGRGGGGWNAGREHVGDSEEDDNDDDAASNDSDLPYFTSNAAVDESSRQRAAFRSPSRSPSRGRKMTDRAGYAITTTTDPDTSLPWQIETTRKSSIGDMMKALWGKEGAWGIWKGQNSSFVYNVLLRTLESWTGSFLSAILSLPDPGLTDIADSTYPLFSLGVGVAASAITAMILSPLDIVRTRLIITPTTEQPRNILPSLRLLPSYFCPPSLLLPTTLHATIPSLISLGTPYFLRTRFGLDSVLTPTLFTLFAFFSSTVELAVTLPLETVLRRAQVEVANPTKTIVPVGRYAGVVGTMWCIIREEDGGKWGIEGLYRGWKLGLWTNVGVLGLGLVGVQGREGSEF